jgi:hypothetical protein
MEKAKLNDKPRTPLRIYIVWHPSFLDGKRYADAIYRIFSRDERDFCGQSIGIPVYYITSVANFRNIDEAEKTVIIPLVDTKLILDKGFKNYVDILCCIPDQNSNYIVFPVSFINVINIPDDMPNLKKNQCIRLFNVGALSENKFFEKLKALRFDLTHEICRLLCGREMSNFAEGLKPSVKIFVSHAGEDGRELAKKILLPMSSAADIATVPSDLFSKFQISFYNSPEDAVIKSMGIE